MLFDVRKHVRHLAVQRIVKARISKTTNLRQFCCPQIQFESEDYIDVIYWPECEITEPPATSNLTKAQLRSFVENYDTDLCLIPNLPCHSQAVERTVKVASSKVCGQSARDGFIRSLT